MKKSFALLMAAPLALASCGVLGIPNGDVTGSISGTAPTNQGTIRLGLYGTTLAGINNSAPDQLAITTFNPSKKVYSISLPSAPAEGVYDVFAFADKNNNSRWDLGETRTKVSGKALLYSRNGSDVLNIKKGWTLYEGIKAIKTGTPFNDYNLSW